MSVEKFSRQEKKRGKGKKREKGGRGKKKKNCKEKRHTHYDPSRVKIQFTEISGVETQAVTSLIVNFSSQQLRYEIRIY